MSENDTDIIEATTSTADEQQPDSSDDTGSEPHGDDNGGDTDWVAEARKWEKRAKSNQDAAKRLKEMEDAQKTELERAQESQTEAVKRAEAAERRLTILEVAAEKGLTPAQAKRLTGDTREELEADADDLLALLAPDNDPPPGGRPKRLHSGNGTDPSKTFDPEALAAKIANRNTF